MIQLSQQIFIQQVLFKQLFYVTKHQKKRSNELTKGSTQVKKREQIPFKRGTRKNNNPILASQSIDHRAICTAVNYSFFFCCFSNKKLFFQITRVVQ